MEGQHIATEGHNESDVSYRPAPAKFHIETVGQ
jgi:hypothetical protein